MSPQANKSVKPLTTAYQDQEIFRTSWYISVFCCSTNLLTWPLWDMNMFPTAVYSPKQAEKWPQVRKTFLD